MTHRVLLARRDMSHHRLIDYGGDTILGTREAMARHFGRHPNVIRRNCKPVACYAKRSHTDEPLMLYDMAEVEATLRKVARRFRGVA